MNNMMHIASGINVLPLQLALKRNPQLWNEITSRTEHPESPHRDVSDIHIRYNDLKNHENRVQFNLEHDSVWYPSVAVLPEVKEIAFQLMGLVRGERLGGILITRIPPGKQCFPHIDGGWHASYYDKYAIQIQGNAEQAFCFDNESFSAAPGDVYWFDNSTSHWVTNNSNEDRITLIVCIRSERYKGV